MVYNFAESGDGVVNINANYATQPHTVAPAAAWQGYIFTMMGVNNLSGGTSAITIFANIENIWKKARNDDFLIIAFEVLPSTDLTGAKETERVALNVLIQNASSLYDVLVPVPSEMLDPSDTDYYIDGTHTTVLGASTLADDIVTLIDAL